jgi:hypothetical protein
MRTGVALCAALLIAGCSALGSGQVQFEPVSIQTVEYYPFQVKGYQNTYPKRRIAVIPALDARDFKEAGAAGHESSEGHSAIGVIVGQRGEIEQRLYGPSLEPLIRDAIAQAAGEAGMVSSTSSQTLPQALAARTANYVLAAKITRCWLNKHRGPDNASGATWFASADVTLEVAVYKPPFSVPFWHNESVATYDDPPALAPGASADEATEIYDEPGQVLSVALTRAAAGIFKREDLHSLILEDSGIAH